MNPPPNTTFTPQEAENIAQTSKDTTVIRIVANYIDLLKNPPAWFTPVDFPLPETLALRIRGCGLKAMKKMQALGLVIGPNFKRNPFMDDLESISKRLPEALGNLGISTPEECLAALKSGKLKAGVVRNFGKGSHAALIRYFHLAKQDSRPRCKCCVQVIRNK